MASGLNDEIDNAIKDSKEFFGDQSFQKTFAHRSASCTLPSDTNKRFPTLGNIAQDDRFWGSSLDQGQKQYLMEECTMLKESRLSTQNECLQLRDKVSALFQENCSLKEHSAKLTMENRALKKQAMSLADDNAKLKERLFQFSHQLKCFVQNRDGSAPSLLLTHHAEQVKFMLDFLNTVHKSGEESRNPPSYHAAISRLGSNERSPPALSLEADNQSLEHISNKLLDQLKQEKMELELQYSQMVEIQKSGTVDSSDRNFDLSLVVDKDLLGALEVCKSNSQLMKNEVKRQNELINNMCQQMETLQKAQVDLHVKCKESKNRKTISSYSSKNNSDDSSHSDKRKNSTGASCDDTDKPKGMSEMSPSLEVLLKTYGNALPGWDASKDTAGNVQGIDEDRICPMCQAVFPRSIPLREFEAHVMEHFSSEDFEIITQEIDYG